MTRLRFIDTGSAGRVLVLLHAFPMDRTMWDAQIAALAGRFRLIAPDAFGFGETPAPRGGWTLAGLAAAVIEMADDLRLTDFAVAGVSMGGYGAFEVVRAAPHRVNALVLANTRARADTPSERAGRAALADDVERDGVNVLADRMVPRLLGPHAPPDVIDFVARSIRDTEPAVVRAALEALAGRRDSSEILANIRCPTLVIAGEDDAITGLEDAQTIAGGIAGSRIVVLPEAGHLSNLEQPERFNDAVRAFLET